MATSDAFVPETTDLGELKAAAAGCRGCHLYENATQTVFGRGDPKARLVFVGEQPGDVEDRHGLPFVGPAGRLLRRAVDEVGIDPSEIYITNAVKHFKFVQRGPRRIHRHARAVITVVRGARIGAGHFGAPYHGDLHEIGSVLEPGAPQRAPARPGS